MTNYAVWEARRVLAAHWFFDCGTCGTGRPCKTFDRLARAVDEAQRREEEWTRTRPSGSSPSASA